MTLAAAGGIHPGHVADYVSAGARLIVTSWPYTAPPRDVAACCAALALGCRQALLSPGARTSFAHRRPLAASSRFRFRPEDVQEMPDLWTPH